MRKREIKIRPNVTPSQIENILRHWANQENAIVKPMGRLVREYKSKGENMHWHISGLRKNMGTVEVTYLPSASSLTILVHDNRLGFWAGYAYLALTKQIARRLQWRRRTKTKQC